MQLMLYQLHQLVYLVQQVLFLVHYLQKKKSDRNFIFYFIYFIYQNHTTYMLSVTDDFRGPGLVFTMLKKCFGEDFDAKGNCSQVAFTKDYRV